MAVVGGIRVFQHGIPHSCGTFILLKPLPINTFTKIPVGKITIKTVGFFTATPPKKWRWLAVVGGNRVFYAFFNLLKPAVPICGTSVGISSPRTILHSPRFVSPQNGNKKFPFVFRLFAVQDVPKGIPNPDPGFSEPNFGTGNFIYFHRPFFALAIASISL